jgi:hypothetical protein
VEIIMLLWFFRKTEVIAEDFVSNSSSKGENEK